MKAANLGHADSQTAVGMMKLKGLGMEVDTVGAMGMFKRAVEQDNSNGYWLLGK
jgi:TPR repeat protein